jgi:hypothetical protein
LIAQNGPINDHTVEADAFTSALRDMVAAATGALAASISMAKPIAALRVTKTVRPFDIFLMNYPCHLWVSPLRPTSDAASS